MVSGAKVLIVDDDDAIRQIITALLSKMGYKVSGACDGLEGIQRFEEFSPDVVITDLVMPRFDGIQFFERIREKAPTIKVIIITAHRDIEEVSLAKEMGAHSFIFKPFSLDEITVKVSSALSDKS
jgi:DNA-binding NtrC family response regulator